MSDYIRRADALINCPNIAHDAIMSIPAADVSEAKHGKWIKATGMMPPEYHHRHICSVCERFALDQVHKGREELSDYCPNCGAKMLEANE